MNQFRTLHADEIDCRISQIKENEGKPSGLTLLLYKDARCDQNILDEVVGAFNWKREHTRDNRNCIVSLWDDEKQQWVGKEDTGTESNTEKEKGLASDSFKRACFNWGIGRELYTAPFIWISADKCNISRNKYGKLACYDNFTVTDIDYLNGNICYLTIKNEKTGKECFRWGERGKIEEKPVAPDNEPDPPISIPQSNGTVSSSNTLPDASEEIKYLSKAMKDLREARGISAEENKKLFREQHKALINAGMAPNKDIKDYKLDELKALIDAMYKNFTPNGTELKVG